MSAAIDQTTQDKDASIYSDWQQTDFNTKGGLSAAVIEDDDEEEDVINF